jgi:hypothetical protein
MNPHFSWCDINDELNVEEDIPHIQDFFKKEYNKLEEKHYVLQNDIIPVYTLDLEDFDKEKIQKDIYKTFFFNSGAIIIKNAYKEETMDKYNLWCEENLELCNKDSNSTHPKQSDKYLLNDVIGRMSDSNPDLLMDLINNEYFTNCIDILGVPKIGSCTGHRINSQGDRQKSHVDYPAHIGSGKFWNNDINKFKNLTTKYHANFILPFFSAQVLLAPHKMNKENGSTEIVPCSHLLQDLDILIHDKKILDDFEKYFINVELEKGDMLIFSRGLCHRGGKNTSPDPRNSLIVQCVWWWGVGQEIIESSKVFERLEKSRKFNELEKDKKDRFKLRLDFPFPKNVKESA